jgi:glutaredoxin
MPRPGGRGREKGGAACKQKIGPFVNPLHLAALLWQNRERHVVPTNFRFLPNAPGNAAHARTKGVVPGAEGAAYEFFQMLRLLMNERPFICHGMQLARGHRGQTGPDGAPAEAVHAQCNDVAFRLVQVSSPRVDRALSPLLSRLWFFFETPDHAGDTRSGVGRVRFTWPYQLNRTWTQNTYRGLTYRPTHLTTMPSKPADTSGFWDQMLAAMSVHTRRANQTAAQYVAHAEDAEENREALQRVAVAAAMYVLLRQAHGAQAFAYQRPAGVNQNRYLFDHFRREFAAARWDETDAGFFRVFAPLPLLFTKPARPGGRWDRALTTDPSEPQNWSHVKFHLHAAPTALSICDDAPAHAAGAVPGAQKRLLVECAADGQWMLQAVPVQYYVGAQAHPVNGNQWRTIGNAQLQRRVHRALETRSAPTLQLRWRRRDWVAKALVLPNSCLAPNSHGHVCRNCGVRRADPHADRRNVPWAHREACASLFCSFHGNDAKSDVVDLIARQVRSEPVPGQNGFRARGRGVRPRANRGLLTTFKNYYTNVPKFLQNAAQPENHVAARNWNQVRGAYGTSMPWSKIFQLLHVAVPRPGNNNGTVGVFDYFADQQRFFANARLRDLSLRQLSDAGAFGFYALLELATLQKARDQWAAAGPAQRNNLLRAYDRLTQRPARQVPGDGQLRPVQRRRNARAAPHPQNRPALRVDPGTGAAALRAGGTDRAGTGEEEEEADFAVVVKPGCGYCERAVALLASRHVTPTVGVTDDFARVASVLTSLKLPPIPDPAHRTFPVVYKNGAFLGGFTELQAHLLGRPMHVLSGGQGHGGAHPKPAHAFILFVSDSDASRAAEKLVAPHGAKVVRLAGPAHLRKALRAARGSTGMGLRLPHRNMRPTLPVAFTATGEYVGGLRDLRRLYRGGIVDYGYATKHFTSREKREVEYLIHHVLPAYAPWVTRFQLVDSSRARDPAHLFIVLHKLPGAEIMAAVESSDPELEGMSVTRIFLPGRALQSDVYFNEANWDHPPAHFDNPASYHYYLVVHELLHALGIHTHTDIDTFDAGGAEAGTPCNIMVQQTRPEMAGRSSPCHSTLHLSNRVPASIATRVVGVRAATAAQQAALQGGGMLEDMAHDDAHSLGPIDPVRAGDVRQVVEELSEKEEAHMQNGGS